MFLTFDLSSRSPGDDLQLVSVITIPAASHRGAKVGNPWRSALESAPEGAPGNRGAPGGVPESAQGNRGCSRECSRECSMCGVNRKNTLGSTPWSTPNFSEHSWAPSPEHPDFPEHPREHFREHFSTDFPL